MPEMGGLETLQELMHLNRSCQRDRRSPARMKRTVVEAIRLGAHDYLTKPFEKSELEAAYAEVPADPPDGYDTVP